MKYYYTLRKIAILFLLCLIGIAVQGQTRSAGPIKGEVKQYSMDLRHINWSDFEGLLPASDVATRGEGDAKRWIDRVGNMPDYLTDFYQQYGEKVKEVLNGGENWLSDPTKANLESYSNDLYDVSFYTVPIKTITGTSDFTFPAGSSQDVIAQKANEAMNEVSKQILEEFDCYIRYLVLCLNYDFPEAFWTGNSSQWGSSWGYNYQWNTSAGTGTIEYTIPLTFTLQVKKLNKSTQEEQYFDYRINGFRTQQSVSDAVTEFNNKVKSVTDPFVGKSRYEQVAGLNDWLTTHNCYNSDLLQTGTADDIAWSPLSALRESVGALGPVCEGYARAFKVLCDKLSIPCMLASGDAKGSPSDKGEAHMWNETQMENNQWYAVDVTWNDPTIYGVESQASGYENHNWLLLGKNDEVSQGFTFAESHPNTPGGNNPLVDQWQFIFTSLIADSRYVPSSNNEEVINFADTNVKKLCVDNWDTNGDGELSYTEAAAVTDIGKVFYNQRIVTFNELQYFTNLKVIGPMAFHFSDVTSIKFPVSLEEIGSGAFDETGLVSIDGGVTNNDFVIPDHVKILRWEAFAVNEGIHSVKIPASVTLMEPLCFRSCRNLKSFTIDEANPVYKMVDGWVIENGTRLLFSPIPQNVESLVIPEGITSVASYAGSYGVVGLKELTLPASLKSIEVSAFYNLTKVISQSIEPAELEVEDDKWYPFDEATFEEATLYVPAGTKEKYQAAIGWKNFKNIVEMGETAPITIGKSGKASYCGDKSLDFSFSDEVKAYIATGFDETEGTIWLTRVKDVPAGTPVLIKGVAEKTYQVPVTDSQNSYYKNMFVGNTSGDKIQISETEGDLVNYYLSGDGTFKKVKNYANIGNNKSYLQLPGMFAPAETGTTQTVTIKSSGKASYAAPVDLDFTNVEGLKAFTATGYDKSSKTIWLTRVMKIQKGEGVLLKGEAKDYEIPSVAVQSSYMNMFVGNTSGNEILVQETSDDGTLTNYYLKGDGTFVSVKGYAKIGNNKCYLALPTEMVAAASTRGEANYLLEEPEVIKMPIGFMSLDSDANGTTGVKEVKSGEVKSEEWFTLQGQRVLNPGKGLYIKNGRKVVIK